MIDIAYIVSHGFAARMVLQTDLLGKLAKKGLNIALICPDKRDASLHDYCKENGIQLYEFRSSSSRLSAQYHEARRYFLEDIKSNPALWEKHIYAKKYTKEKSIIGRIRPHVLILFYYLKKWFPGLKSWYKKREEKHLYSPKAVELIKKINPKKLLSTYPVNFDEAKLLNAAKKNDVKTIIHLLSWDNISCKGHFPVLSVEFIAWGSIMKEEIQQYYGVTPEKIHSCGVPHFDIHIDSKKHPKYKDLLVNLGLDPSLPYLFFGMSSPRFAPREIDIVEWLAKAIDANLFDSKIQLVIRPHPQNIQGGMEDKSWLPRLEALKSKRVALDFPNLVKDSKMPWSMQKNDMVKLSQLLSGSAVCLNSGSTLSIDALMCDVPVILTSFDGNDQLDYWQSARRLTDYNHLAKLISYNGVSVSRSYDDLKIQIFNYIKDNDFLLPERKNTIEKFCISNEEKATEKVVNLLTQKINS